MGVPTTVPRGQAPIVTSDAYAWVAPTSLTIDSAGPFVRGVSATGDPLPQYGGYSAGSLESRVLQLLHEVGHLFVERVYSTTRVLQVGGATRLYQMEKLDPLLDIDGSDADLSAPTLIEFWLLVREQYNIQ